MPTGGGKSLCYQIPALLSDGLTVVVSPLISLMKDQLDQLHELGIPAGMLNSTLDADTYNTTVQTVRNNELRLLYCAPETLLQQRTIALLRTVPVYAIAVDEAHCISQWGHDFRPEYRKIAPVRQIFRDAVCIALTATATDRVRNDILRMLEMKQGSEFVAGFDRPNLFIEIIPKLDPDYQALDFIRKQPDSPGIVYCFSRRQVDELYFYLSEHNIKALPYHAGMSDETRKKNQELFRRDEVQVMVATIAFGMGINKPDIRFVLHYDLPQNIESYYQQIGRAGRDGLDARCRVLFGYEDVSKIQYIINQKSENEKRVALHQLDTMLAFLENSECRRKGLLRYFSEEYTKENCKMCDNCVSPKEDEKDLTVEAQKFLSCVARMEQRYGAGLIIDVLRGSQSKKVRDSGGMRVSTYGIGSDLSKEQWMMIYRQMSVKGLLSTDTQYRTIRLTPDGAAVMKGEKKFTGRISAAYQETYRDTKTAAVDNVLLNRLKSLRKEIARKEGVPPYVIFPDKTLIEMTRFLPENDDELLLIHGIGRVKLERFGRQFLPLINEQEGAAKRHIVTKDRKTRTKKEYAYEKTAAMFNDGMSTAQIANINNVKIGTIISHLDTWVEKGNSVSKERLYEEFAVSEEMQVRVFQLFDQHGTKSLSLIRESLHETIEYDILKIIRIAYTQRGAI